MNYPKGSMLRQSAIASCVPIPDKVHFVFFQDNQGRIRQISFDGNYTGGCVYDAITNPEDAKWHTPLASVCYTRGDETIIRLWYLDQKNLIRGLIFNPESRFWGQDQKFNDRLFSAAAFSNLAAVITENSIKLFHQTGKNELYEIPIDIRAGPLVPSFVGRAVLGTGLAASYLKSTRETNVFYQDSNATLGQLTRKGDGKWVKGALQTPAMPLQCGLSAFAYSMNPNHDFIRLFIIESGKCVVSKFHISTIGWNVDYYVPYSEHTTDSLNHSNIATIGFTENGEERYRAFYQGEFNEMLSYGWTSDWKSLEQIPTS